MSYMVSICKAALVTTVTLSAGNSVDDSYVACQTGK